MLAYFWLWIIVDAIDGEWGDKLLEGDLGLIGSLGNLTQANQHKISYAETALAHSPSSLELRHRFRRASLLNKVSEALCEAHRKFDTIQEPRSLTHSQPSWVYLISGPPYAERDRRGNSFIEWKVVRADNWGVDRVFVDQHSHGDTGLLCANQLEGDNFSVGDTKVGGIGSLGNQLVGTPFR